MPSTLISPDGRPLKSEAIEIVGATLGATNEAAPAGDTTSGVGLNGRLQRIAQNISTLFSRFAAPAALANGASVPTTTIVGAAGMQFNGTTFDLAQSNQEGTALASAARTATANSADISNVNARGVMVFLNVTAASGTGGLVVRVQAKDPVSGQYMNINAAPTAITANGSTLYIVYPGSSGTGAAALSTAMVIPRTFRISVTHNDASSYTYSVGYSLIV